MKHSINQSFKSLFVILFTLFVVVNVVSGQDETPSGQPFYLAAFKAENSNASTGSGFVKLTWIDAQGELFANPLAAFLNDPNQMPYATGNPSNSDNFSSEAMVVGATLTATESVEDSDPNSQVNGILRNLLTGNKNSPNIFMTPFAYFKADAQGAEGSYFVEWTFNDAKVIRQDTAMDKEHPESAYYKVLPNSANVFYMKSQTEVAGLTEAYFGAVAAPNTIYAVFKKYLLANPVVVNNGVVGTSANATTTLDMYIDVEGDMSQLKDDYADFNFPASTFAFDDDVEWSWTLADNPFGKLSAAKGRVHIIVSFKTKKDIEEGTYRTVFPVSMQGTNPSTLDVKLSVYARPMSINVASVKIGNLDPVEYETLAEAVDAANGATGDVTLTLLKNIAVYSSVTLSNTIKLDLNGYVLSAAPTVDMVGQPVLKIAGVGKTVTLVYNKQGGAIQAAPAVGALGVMGGLGVEVAAGTLVLNGGTIASENALTTYDEAAQTAAIKVNAGATLIQNGATITATSAGPNAIGIYNEGTVQIKEGSVSAEAGFNNAMAVYALNGSSTTIDGGSLSALAKEQDGTTDFSDAIPNGIPTWTNAYAVNVAEGSTVTVNGGDLYAEATNANRAYAVSALAGFGGKLIVNKGATVRAKSPNSMYSFPVALMTGDVTINGGKFDGKYMDNITGETNNPAVFGVNYEKFSFVSGTCKTEKFFTENANFPTSYNHPTYKKYSVVKASQDYIDGYRYIAVAEDADLASVVPACRIGSVGYNTLEDAIAYANNNPSEEVVIFMMRNYTLPAGYYTLPAKATIVVPMSDEQAKEINLVPLHITFNDIHSENPYVENVPQEFRRLTFAEGVNMEVFGDIEVTCTQLASNEAYTSQPVGPYGRLVLAPGSHITLQSGSNLRAWGFVTGDGTIGKDGTYLSGEIDARRGANVYEMFQLGDWKGATTSVAITGMMGNEEIAKKKIFPVTQYFIQNIESPVKYHPGAILSTSATVSEGIQGFGGISVTMNAPDIKIVSVTPDQAIFLMDQEADAENTWVRKWYDVKNDVQTYEVNSGAHIGSMVLDMGRLSLAGFDVPVQLNSAKYDLPITSNMKIHLLTGEMDFLQNTSLLPGAEVEVDKESTVSVSMSEEELEAKNNNEDRVYYTGALYVYDKQDWDKYAYCKEYTGKKFVSSTAYTKTVRYAPSWNGQPTIRNEQECPASAAINVHGTFQTATGFVYTSEHGANIFSTNKDAGTFIFNNAASEAADREVWNVYGSGDWKSQIFYPARLKNGNNEYVNTDEAKAGDAYCYINNEWTTMYADPDNTCFIVKRNDETGDTYYAKPAEYVAIQVEKRLNNVNPDDQFYEYIGNPDHTYSDADGAGRLFILTSNCQWWEVEKKDNLYHCIHPQNDTYYHWVSAIDGESGIDYGHWEEKRFNITWKNWDGTIIQTGNADGDDDDEYSVTYGTMAEFLGTNPTRKPDIDYTYDFTGWSPELAPVTSNVTYTATYEKKERKYTITFLQEGGVEIERQFLPHNAVPVCENTPTKIGHTLVWSPAIAAVTGDATYTATWKEEPPTEYEVTFYDYDGTTLLQQSDVNVGDKPTPPVIEDGKPVCDGGCESGKTSSTGEFTYVFDHWSPEPEVVSATSVKSYVAVYSEVPKKYTIYYFMEDGKIPNPTKPSEELPYGATPTPPAVSKENSEAGYTYTLVWKTLDESGNIETVRGTASYKPTYEREENRYNRFTVTLATNIPKGCMLRGTGTYDYGDNATIEAMPVEGYGFVRWEDGSTENPRTITVSTDVSYTAIVREDKTVAIGDVFNADGDIVNDLILESNGSASGQITNANALSVEGNAYFDLTLNANAETWYAFGLPWQVNTNGGISADGRTLVLQNNCYLLEFDGELAANGALDPETQSTWRYVKSGILQPGKLYMIYLRYAASTIRFAKAAGADLVNNTITLEANPSAVDAAAGWNAIANPTTYYAQLTTDAIPTHKGQAYVPGVPDSNGNATDTYMPVDLTSDKLIVGQPLFVQISPSDAGDIVAKNNVFAAPRRAPQTSTEYEVRIAPHNGAYIDRLYISTSDEKEDKYIIGQDLAKISVATGVAQMWVNRYDAKLCANVTEMMNNQATFPLGIYAPKTGQYTLSTVSTTADDEELYVTIDGTPVWDLATGAYTIDLQQGNTNEYGLLIIRRPAPEVTTGCQNVEASENASVRKVLINGQVFILRDGAVYTIFGQKAK